MYQNDAKKLLGWYSGEKRALPWRRSRDPYAVAVSELMLQQTTVAAVVPKYEMWMEKFPDVATLAQASLEDVMSAWSGLGYYQRARRLHRAAVEVHAAGGFPNTYEELLELPGFGPYTAAAVASICFERPALAIDTNVVRVLYRYYALTKQSQDKAAHNELRVNMAPVMDWVDPGELNQALMELGATLCSISAPGCMLCPLERGCAGRKAPGGPEAYPVPKPKKAAKVTPGQIFLVQSTGRILLVKGTSLGLLGDLYQPPLLFSDQADSNALSQLTIWLAEALEDEDTVSEGWSLRYGISGRKLEMKGCSWKLSPSITRALEGFLRDSNIEYQWVCENELRNGAVENLPLSTLTRRVLKKWWESV